MAAAVRLTDNGFAVTVFEAGTVPGGRARRIRISSDGQGSEIDNGQHILVGAYTELLALMQRVDVPLSAVLRVPLELRYADGFAFRAQRLPRPLGLLAGLLTARGLPLAERLGAVRFLIYLKRNGFRFAHDKPVEDLLREHRQDGTIGHYLWRPLCIS